MDMITCSAQVDIYLLSWVTEQDHDSRHGLSGNIMIRLTP